MFARQRAIMAALLQVVLFFGVILFALYEFKQHTAPQPIIFTNAENALKAGNTAAACKEFDNALALRPHDPTAYLAVVQACLNQHNAPLAASYCQKALDNCGRQPALVQFQLYEIMVAEYGQIDKPPHQQRAIAAAKKALDLEPDNHIAANDYGYLLADNATSRGPDVDTAIVVLKRALEDSKKGPTSPTEAQLGPLFRSMAEDSYGWALYKNEQYPDAVTALNAALEDYPSTATAEDRKTSYYHLGMAFSKLGQTAQATNAFNSALAYDPKYADALAGLASLSPSSPEHQPSAQQSAQSASRLPASLPPPNPAPVKKK